MRGKYAQGVSWLFAAAYIAVLLAGLHGREAPQATAVFAMPVSRRVITIDAGHGGWDPGKVAPDGSLEAPINLAVAELLQQYLELGGSTVLMTRADDSALGDTKRDDLNNRLRLADDSYADLFISIHQNSYPQEEVRGAQAFYYAESAAGKRLAESIQAQIKAYLDPQNRRKAKADEGYFLLKNTAVPSVIVECGFLSNTEEGKWLTQEDYQEKIAWAIYMGIVRYFAEEE